jgi:hypothetical protein
MACAIHSAPVSVTAPGRSWRDRATRGLGLDRWEIAALAAPFALSIAVRLFTDPPLRFGCAAVYRVR